MLTRHVLFDTLDRYLMHQRRFAAFILGFWIAGSILISYITVRNQTGIDRALTTPSAGVAQVVDKLGMETSRMFLHFNAAEENEEYFSTWEIVQFVLAFLLAVVLYAGTHISRWWLVVPGCMAVVVGFKHFVLAPEIEWIARGLDAVPEPARGRARYWVLHGSYIGLEGFGVLLAIVLALYLFAMKTPAKRRPEAATAS